MNLGHILFSFSGRINRAKWWLSVLALIIIHLVIAGAIMVFQSEGAASVLGLASLVISLWVTLAAGAKRLHDLNRTAAWLVLFFGGPILLTIIFIAFAGMSVFTTLATGGDLNPAELGRIAGVALIISALASALSLWALIWFGCLRGTVGPNQYGPDPLEGRV